MTRKAGILLLLTALAMLTSCEFISGIIHDDEVVARLGNRKLYKTELDAFIPNGVSAEDSTKLALQYINTWATEQLFSDIAQQQLSKEEQDVSSELEDYRRSLLKYRYEQRYVNERLDTVVLSQEIDDYYHSHEDLFVLDVPIVKARFLDIMQDSPNLELIKDKMCSSKIEDLEMADSLAYSSALRYEDGSEKWVDMVTFARNFGTDYGTLLSKAGKDGFIEIPDERGDVKIAYICEMQRVGELAELDYCEDRIKDIIISTRKQTLLSDLERELLSDALDKETLIIY
ncbi:MAG: hypothetical protein IJM29_00920 [Bacteroidales bacterium]|nr:hypothetical protein [Bacteroidales bacterium]